jgi:hypothetical protein
VAYLRRIISGAVWGTTASCRILERGIVIHWKRQQDAGATGWPGAAACRVASSLTGTLLAPSLELFAMEGSMDLSEDMALHSRMRGSKKGGKKKKQKKGKKKKGKNDAAKSDEIEFGNPIASGEMAAESSDSDSDSSEAESDVEEEEDHAATFETEVAEKQAHRMKKKHLESSSVDHYQNESVLPPPGDFIPQSLGSVICCCSNEAAEAQRAYSCIAFDALSIVSDDPQISLVRDDGSVLNFLRPSDLTVDKEDIPRDDKAAEEEAASLAYMQEELRKVTRKMQKMIRKAEIGTSDGKGLAAHQVTDMYTEQISFWEKEIEDLKHNSAETASADHKQRLKDIKKSQRRGETSKDGSSVVLEDPGKPIGITWHWQANRAVVAVVREGGVAASYENGEGVIPGMVLKEFRNATTGRRTQVTHKAITEKLRGRKPDFQPGEETQYLQALMEMAGRPLTLIFEKKGFTLDMDGQDMTKAKTSQMEVSEQRLGVAVMPLEYTVPKERGDLGLKFWPHDCGSVVISDVVKPSMFGKPQYIKQGIRPGLKLQAIASADGYTRSMNLNSARSSQVQFKSTLQKINVTERPYIAIFDPTPVPLEFTFDNSLTCAVPTKSDEKAMKARSGKGFSIFRELGLSLVEEDISEWGDTDWRVRVSGLHAGGMIDRFNRHNRHNWIHEGLTIVSVRSKLKHVVNLVGEPLPRVVKAFHAAAPGIKVQLGKGKQNKTVLSGREITIGFKIDCRAREVDLAKWVE